MTRSFASVAVDAFLAERHRLIRRRIRELPLAVARRVQILRHVQRDRFEERADATVDFRQRHQRAQHHRRIVAARWTADDETGNVAQRGDRIVVVEMPAETALIAQARDAHHHRIAVLPVREELQRRRFAADLIAGVVEIRQILDFGHRQHAHIPETLRETEDHRFVEQRVEHARVLERFVQALGQRIYAAFLRHVFAEQQRFRIFAEQIVQRVVDQDRQMPRRLFFRQLRFAAEDLEAARSEIRALRFRRDFVGVIRRERRHHVVEFGQFRTTIRFFGRGETFLADRFVAFEQLLLSYRCPLRARSPPSAAADRSLRRSSIPRPNAIRFRNRYRRDP